MVLRVFIILFIGLPLTLFAYTGKGEGTTRQEAIDTALNSVASHISTTVSSKLQIVKKSSVDSYNRSVEQTIYSEVRDIIFNNYKILKEENRAEKYFVILEVDSKKLAEGYDSRIGQKLNSIKRELQQPSLLKRYLLLNRYNLKELLSQTYLMESINPNSPNRSRYITEIEQLLNTKTEYQQKLTFRVTSNESAIENIARSILNEFEFIASSEGRLQLNITLSSLKITEIYKKFGATAKATIDIEEDSNIVVSKTISLQATSYIDRDYLKDEIIKGLESELKSTLKEMLR